MLKPQIHTAMKNYNQIINLYLGEKTESPLIYSIINTRDYDGGMGVIVIECESPSVLEDYGFKEDEISEVAKLEVGQMFTSFDYGTGCVCVRMA